MMTSAGGRGPVPTAAANRCARAIGSLGSQAGALPCSLVPFPV